MSLGRCGDSDGACVDALAFRRDGTVDFLDFGRRVSFAAAFDQNVSLERILSREALVAMPAREWLHGQVYPLVPLQVMIAIEALRALIASERPVILGARV